MLNKSLISFSLFLLLLPAAFPQRGGRQGQGPGMGQSSGMGQYGAQAGNVQREQKRIHATEQQRNQIRECNKLADGIRKQARKMSQASGKKFNAAEAKQQQSQIRDQLRTMEQKHERLMNGLDAPQQQAWQAQIKNMNQSRQQLNFQMQRMDNDLGSANPDSKRIAERAKEMEKTMKNWRKQYNILSSQVE